MKKRDLYTTRQESEELLRLGMDPSTADMRFPNEGGFWGHGAPVVGAPALEGYREGLPCWSMGALIELLPKEGPKSIYRRQLLYELIDREDAMGYCVWVAKYLLEHHCLDIECHEEDR